MILYFEHIWIYLLGNILSMWLLIFSPCRNHIIVYMHASGNVILRKIKSPWNPSHEMLLATAGHIHFLAPVFCISRLWLVTPTLKSREIENISPLYVNNSWWYKSMKLKVGNTSIVPENVLMELEGNPFLNANHSFYRTLHSISALVVVD